MGTVLELPTRTRVGELAALRDVLIPHFAVIRGVNILLGGEAESTQETPILITTLTTLGGVLPTAYGIGGCNSIISLKSVAIG